MLKWKGSVAGFSWVLTWCSLERVCFQTYFVWQQNLVSHGFVRKSSLPYWLSTSIHLLHFWPKAFLFHPQNQQHPVESFSGLAPLWLHFCKCFLTPSPTSVCGSWHDYIWAHLPNSVYGLCCKVWLLTSITFAWFILLYSIYMEISPVRKSYGVKILCRHILLPKSQY